MTRDRVGFVALNVAGGLAVLGSYALGVSLMDDPGRMWGGIPEGWKPVYTVSMLLAAAGYFPFTWYFLTRVDPARARIGGAGGWGVVLACYGLVLVGSALWLPLTARMLTHPSPALWTLIRLDLLAVGAGAVGLLVSLVVMRPRDRSAAFWAAVTGLLPFCWQTAVLDALVWPAYFPAP
jgi:hypothetical protein